jgi:hypothetical protein
MGKHKPIYDPSTDCGDYVVVTNCSNIRVTGKKMQQKLYYSHTTRPGSLKSISMERMMDKWGGAEVLRRAVRGMLPKNRLRDVRLARMKSKFCLVRVWPDMKLTMDSFRGTCASTQEQHPEVPGTGGRYDKRFSRDSKPDVRSERNGKIMWALKAQCINL